MNFCKGSGLGFRIWGLGLRIGALGLGFKAYYLPPSGGMKRWNREGELLCTLGFGVKVEGFWWLVWNEGWYFV